MSFSAQDVKALRDRTGVGMMDCKNALKDSAGDLEKAVELLREKGLAAASKKADRIAADGMVYATANRDDNVGAIIEVNSETDFVAKNESFQEFVKDLATVVMEQNPADLDELKKAKMADVTVEEELNDKILVIGENLIIRRFNRFDGPTVAYIHAGGTHGVLVQFDTSAEIAAKPEFVTFGRDVAMHIAAENPTYVSRDDVPENVLAEEKEILKAQAVNEGKPEHIAEKIVMGRINKFYETNCLLEQKFVKDNDITVKEFIDQTAKDLGGDISVVAFTRYEKGEGLEKREECLANEIADMVN